MSAAPLRLTFPELPFAGDPATAIPSNISAARQWATDAVAKARQGVDPRPKKATRQAGDAAKAGATFGDVARQWIKAGFPRKSRRHPLSEAEVKERKRRLERYLIPAFGETEVAALTHARIVEWYNGRAESAPVGANRALGDLRQLFKWYRGQTGTFVSPIVSDDFRLAETASAGRSLTDMELALVWQAADVPGTPAANMKARIKSVMGNIINQTIAELKATSKNGSSGYGSLTEQEAERIASQYAALDQTQSTGQFVEQLARLKGYMQQSRARVRDAYAADLAARGQAPGSGKSYSYNPSTGKLEATPPAGDIDSLVEKYRTKTEQAPAAGDYSRLWR